MPEWILAIDFGTTSTAAAMRVGHQAELVEIDGAPRMPSMVFWREGTGGHTGRLVLGEEADNLASRAPWCLERTPKRRIGDELLLLGDQEVRVTDAVGAILRKAAEEAISRRGGQAPAEVRLTHPARWGQASLAKLRQAARVAGFDSPVFVPEPVAAAIHFATERLAVGEHVAVYDLGGGTFDTAVLRRTEDSFAVVGAPGGDEDLGGEDFDDRLYRHLGVQLGEEGWRTLRESRDRSWSQANRQLLREARRAKEILSRSPDYDIYVPPPIDREMHVTADELRGLIEADLQSTVAELERTIRGAGLQPSQIAAIYLAGGSSRIPLVARLIQQRLGLLPDYLDDPKSVIALGAARPPQGQLGSAEPTIAPTAPAAPGHTDQATAPRAVVGRPAPAAPTALAPTEPVPTASARTEVAPVDPTQPSSGDRGAGSGGVPPAPPGAGASALAPDPPAGGLEAGGAPPGQGAEPPGAPPQGPPPDGHSPSAPGPPPPSRRPSRPGRPLALIALAVVALAGIAAGALAAGGVFSSGGSTQTVTTTNSRVASATSQGTTTPPSSTTDRDAVVSTLRDYEAAYTNQDLNQLGSLFTADVYRHGLRSGGCSDTFGRDAVLRTYSEQFAAGTGTYTLTDLSSNAVQIAGSTAQVNTHYSISNGSTGTVAFTLVNRNPQWKISRIVATC